MYSYFTIMITLVKRFMILLTSAFMSLSLSGSSLFPERLRCEYLLDPVSIDVPQPRLSWELRAVHAGSRGLRQSAYQVQVASSKDLLAKGKADLWESGKVFSEETAGIVYSGMSLTSRSHCYWMVRVWDQNGLISSWSETAMWTMGLLKPSDWQAKWISYPLSGPGTEAHFGYRSALAQTPYETKWVQIDLGEPLAFHAVRLWGAWPIGNGEVPGSGFPLRFRIEAANHVDFSDARIIVDRTSEDVPNPGNKPLLLGFPEVRKRFVRLTAEKLSGGFTPVWDTIASRWRAEPADFNWRLALAEMEVLQGDTNIALGKIVTSPDSIDSALVSPAIPYTQARLYKGWSTQNLTDGRTRGDPGSRTHVRPVTLLRRDFTIEGPVKSAVLYATALGTYEFHLNGERVGDQQLAPGWTIYQKRVLYQTYDVTDLLRKGPNTIGALLADGWYRMRDHIDWTGSNRRFASYLNDDQRWLLGQLEIEYENGVKETMITDPSWRCYLDGPLRHASIYDGVLYDARKEIPGWDKPGLSSMQDWLEVIERPVGDTPVRSAQMMEPMRIVRELKPCRMTQPQPNVSVYDFGEQLTGVCRIQVTGSEGTRVNLRYAEMLKPDGNLYVANLIGACDNQDVLMLGGPGSYEFTPSFVYHGFRYVEVSGLAPEDTLGEIIALETISDLTRAATFKCSDPRMNQLCNLVDRAYRSCMKSLTVDVAARDERMPWLGDCYTDEIQSLSYLYDYAAFGANHLQVLTNALSSDGIAPEFIATVKAEGSDGIAGWCDASVTAPYTLWLNYADISSLEKGYRGAAEFMNTLEQANPDGVPGERYRSVFGDWLSSRMTIPPAATDWEPKGGKGAQDSLFAAAFWAQSAEIVSKMAAALERPEDSLQYAGLTATIRKALIRNHVHPDGRVGGDEQSSYALTLGMNHLNGPLRRMAEKFLLNSIDKYDEHLATGSISTIYLLKYLAGNGYQDLAYRMVMQPTCPSYGFMVDNGATAMWERFDGWHPGLGFNPSIMNAFNHLGMNSVFEWIFGYIAGIRPDPVYPGYKHFFIGPKLVGDLTWMKASYNSLRGRIETSYEIKGEALEMRVVVPPNTNATLFLPASTLEDVTESGQDLTQTAGIEILNTGAILLQSGTYLFTIPKVHEQ